MFHESVSSGTLWVMAERGVLVPGLQQIRKWRLLSQQELASAAGVARTTVVRAEAGKRIDPPVVRRLASALEVEATALMGVDPR